jgi:hypothetical protein
MKFRVTAFLRTGPNEDDYQRTAVETVEADASDEAWQRAAEQIAERQKHPRAAPIPWDILEVELQQ